jgi:hypothetical protein
MSICTITGFGIYWMFWCHQMSFERGSLNWLKTIVS